MSARGNLVSADRVHTTVAHLGREAGVRTRSRGRAFHDIDRVRSGLARGFVHVPTAPTHGLASRGRTWSETMALWHLDDRATHFDVDMRVPSQMLGKS